MLIDASADPTATPGPTPGPAPAFLDGGGDTGRLIAAHDWARTTLGPIHAWPQSLRTATAILLRSPVPLVMLWGEHGVMLYNDAYSVFAGGRHPRLLGSKVREGWPEVAAFNDHVMRVGLAGGTLAYRDQELTLHRSGRPEQVWMDLDYSPVPDESGRPAGVLAVVVETTARVHAERALRDERDRARNLLDGMAEAFALLDRDFRIVDLNPEALRMETRPRDALLGRSVWDAYPGIEHEELGRLYRRAMADRVPVELEHCYTWPGGRIAWIEMRAYPVPAGLAVFYRDVSQRHAADEALRSSEARRSASEESLRLSTDAAEIGTWDLDVVHDQLTWSDRTRAMFGIAPGRPCSMADFYAGLHPDDRPATAAAFTSAIDPASRATYDVEYRTVGRDDGLVRWVAAKGKGLFDADGRCIRALGTAIDITARRRRETRRLALVEFGDRVRDSADPDGLAFAAAEILGRTLGVSRAGYGTIDVAAETITIARDWNAPGVQTLAGVLDFRGYGSYIDDLAQGRTVAIADTRLDPRTAATTAALEAIGARALVNMPVTEHGGLVAVLYLNHPDARLWPDDELAFVHEIADRTRVAIARLVAERELRDSEAKFEAIVNAIDQMIWSTVPDGYHDYYNDRWYQFTGMPVGSTDGEAWIGLFHPDDQARARTVWQRSLDTGAPYHIEYRLRHRSGQYRWVIGRAQCVRDDQGHVTRWFGTCTDIHDLKIAEERLRALNADLEQQVAERTLARGRTWQLSPDLMGVLNHDGYWVASNPAWQAMLGWSEAEVASTVFLDLVHPADVPLTQAAWRDAIDRGAPALHLENRYRTRGGEWRWLSWVAVPEGGRIYCAARDITEARQQADTLVARTRERDRAWKNSRDLQLVLGADGVIRAVNQAWTTLLGWAAEELVGHSHLEFMHPGDLEAAAAALAVAAQGPLPVFESRLRHKHGGWRSISWVAAPEAGLIYASGRDVTAEKERQAELEAAQEALRQSQKMDAVGQLTGGIAHDFNNMLAVVIGSLDLLGRRISDADPRARRYVDAAAEGARRAANLTQRLLAFSRQQPLKPEPLDINRLVAGMSDLLGHALGGAVQLETSMAPDAWRVHADPNQLENVILNLAVNARDAMPGGGRLTIATANTRHAAQPALAPGDYVLISVGDTGTGMTPDVIAKAFDPFFTTKEVGKGTGLGLSQVYGFVKQSGGHVTIHSRPGHGTTVDVHLPRLLGDAPDAPAPQAPAEAPLPDAQEVVLVVEDEPAVRQFSVDALRELGYRVLEADGAAPALRLLDAHPEIAAMFTDVVMPEIDGAKLADEARRRRPDLKVLFTTGYTRDAMSHDGVLDPGVELIGKPFTIDELAARLRAVIDAPPPAPAAGSTG